MNLLLKKLAIIFLSGAVLLTTGCGGGDSSNPSTGDDKPKELERAQLKAEDLNVTYLPEAKFTPKITNQFGKLKFQIAEGESKDIVSVNYRTGLITVLSTGNTRINVEDESDKYKNSSTSFAVNVSKTTNYNLSAQDMVISAIEQEDKFISVQGAKGSLYYEVSDDSFGIVDVDSATGKLTPIQVGRAEVHITDRGNDLYEETTIKSFINIVAVNPDSLTYADLELEYVEGLVLSPNKLSGGDQGSYYYEFAEDYENSTVVLLNKSTGKMQINHVGVVMIKVTNTLGDSYSDPERIAFFKIEIVPAERPELIITNYREEYSPNKKVEPAVNNAKGPIEYRVIDGHGVIVIDSVTKLPKIVGVGEALLEVIDQQNKNYEPSQVLFLIAVSKAPHPGLNNKTEDHVFSEEAHLREITPQIAGKKGQLSYKGKTGIVDIKGEKLVINQAGTAKLKVTDNGGEYYLSADAELIVNVAKGTHPLFKVGQISETFSSNNLCIPLSKAGISGNYGVLAIELSSGQETGIASFNKEEQCIAVQRAGSVKFDVVSLESTNYLQSSAHTLPVVITEADSSISVEQKFEVKFAKGRPVIPAPSVIGQKGTLSFQIDPKNPVYDVVQVDAKTGDMTILNAGTAIVEVTDSGGNSFKPAKTTFPVKVLPIENPVSVVYEETDYEQHKQVFATVTNAESALSFYLENAYNAPVELVDKTSGELKVKKAGTYKLMVTAKKSRNYLESKFDVESSVVKAMHPGITADDEVFYFEPLKEVSLELPVAQGERAYAVKNKSSSDIEFASISPNTGLLTLLNYDPLLSETVLDLHVSEEESNNYQSLAPSVVKQVMVRAPQKGQSSKDVDLKEDYEVVASTINGNARYRNLTRTSMHFSGVAKVLPATEEERKDWGEGNSLFLIMKPVGNDSVGERKVIRVFVQRYVGCSKDVYEENLENIEAKPLDSNSYCIWTETNRFMTYRILNKEDLGAGSWETVTPFVVYQKSEIPFAPTDNGGILVDGGGTSIGGGKGSKLIEWNRIELTINN
ncbi:hypothetical protein [Photobacterium minamisatsumaniensis]|uniref:hypothetical protein n=1 Tax=Photobacterium minamisatsumaniensis TaxID=2910233 RepID=UPI003D0AEEAA